MKKSLLIFSLLFLILSCKESKKEKIVSEKEYTLDFIKTYEGEIGKLPIIIKMKSDNGNITGNYIYKNKSSELKLKGTIDKKGVLNLKEYDKNGNQTGSFAGNLVSENKIIGKWNKPDGSNKLNFKIISSNFNYSDFVKSKEKIISDLYSCPMRCEKGISYTNPGSCPVCKMDLKKNINKNKTLKTKNLTYNVSDVVGNWEIKMNVLNSDCKGYSVNETLVENWIINSSNNKLDIQVINSSTGVKSYTGYLSGNVIHAKTSKRGYKCNLQLYFQDKNNCTGNRKVIKSEPCSIEYYMIAKKK